jgi:hypothetical protein
MMAESEKDRIARQTADLRVTFDMALSNKRKYPMAEFKAFVQSARRYIEITAGDPMIHRSVVQAVNGLREFLQLERKRIPGEILFEADKLECQLFAGYDPIIASTAMSLPAYKSYSRQTVSPAPIDKPFRTRSA